jgi:hypothetical protein
LLIHNAPRGNSEDGEDAFRDLYEQLCNLGNDIHETKLGLIKEMEICEHKEEIIKKLKEEQNRKALQAI